MPRKARPPTHTNTNSLARRHRPPQTFDHNIANCPYAHPGERAVRRDVRLHPYQARVCSDLLQKGKW